MKRRILFVDDEVNILKGLQRSLRPLRKHWEMSFAEGAEKALETLEKERFDVILSDMRMPGMDGAKLLEVVKGKYPTMVRLIFSGHSDEAMIMKSVKSAHQYISKPCEKKVLVSVITRACSLQDILHHEKLKNLLGGIEGLPSLPSLYSQVVEVLNSPDASVGNVGEIVSKDMGMTAKLLQLVNSSFFGMPRHISSPKEAAVLLGIDVVKTLVLGLEVFSKFQNALEIVSVDKIHVHCVQTAIIAKEIGQMETMEKGTVEDAMIGATLHDIGSLLLAEHFPDEYKEVMKILQEQEVPVSKAEQQVFGLSHAEVGAYLLGLWGLPDNIIEGIAFHHSPAKVASKEFEVAGIIHVADLIEHGVASGADHDKDLAGLDHTYLEQVGLMERIPEWRENITTKLADNS